MLADSYATQRFLERRVHVPPHRVRVVPISAVDLQEFPLRGPSGDRQALTVGSVGMLYTAKGYPDLVRAAARVRDVFPNVKFLVAGEGPERKSLMREINQQSLERQFHLLGYVTNVSTFHERLHVYVQPSRWEGLCISAIEAMASGLPVVASNVGGLAETVVHGENGLLVEAGRPIELADAIVDLLSAPKRAREMGQRGRERVAERYTASVMTEAFRAIIEV
jgi:glycosyltransferase involved in cell wall biosynthesis